MALNLTPEITFLIGFVIFWVVLYILARILHLEKRGLDVKPGYFMYRSKAINSRLDKLARKKPVFWTVLSNVGVAFSLGLMALAIYLLANNLLRFAQVGGGSYLVPVVPGITLSLYWLPFYAFAAVVVIIPHELAHGIVSRLENIPVLSTGVLTFLVFFGAFVEPDEKEFEKASLIARIRMLAAGSSTNLVSAILTLILLAGLFPAPQGILIHETLQGGPLDTAGIGRWDVIQAINGSPIVTYSNFSTYMIKVNPGEELTLTVLHDNRVENITVTTLAAEENKSRAIIGFSRWSEYHPSRVILEQYTGVNLYWTLYWTHVIAFSVAVFNMLPLYPFDGERVLYYPLERIVKKRKRELRIAVSGFTLGLFALNVILSLWRFGLFAI